MARPELARMQGCTYHLFHPESLDSCVADDAFLVGDALGLAHPLTAEGILPAVLSGRLCGEAIAAGEPATLRCGSVHRHPLMRDYHRFWRLRKWAAAPARCKSPSNTWFSAAPHYANYRLDGRDMIPWSDQLDFTVSP